MKVLVTGAGGQVAWELEKTCPAGVELFSFSSKELDITNKAQVLEIVKKVCPDVLINAAAYTAVDKAESEPEQAFLVNAEGSKNLAEACKEISARLIHISTDFVFDGTKNTPYTVDDKPNPINVYGASKLKGEVYVQKILPAAVIVRTSWVYSDHGNNFVKTMLRLMNERESISVVADQIGSPTYAKNLAEWIWAVVSKPTRVSGLYNWTDAGVASWYDFAVAINESGHEFGLLSKKINITPIPTALYPTLAIRPPFSVICKAEAEKLSGMVCCHWRESLKEMMLKIG
jgi:dTDP-4-dehydrorhamnose reductase